MCGITGFFDPSLDKETSETLIGTMLQSIAHRGPDAQGHWIDKVALGHRRLSIIDLSEQANQPFAYGNYQIVFNGEVYNYIEIREELKRDGFQFRTDSDTEVICAAYQKWGEQCVQRFMGMWAFALWDSAEEKLFCSRDRFGIKPFYYIFRDGKFYFGSEYKPLKLSPLFCHKVNLRQVYYGLHFGWANYQEQTYFEDIQLLPVANNLTLQRGQLKTYRYWDIDLKKKEKKNFDLHRDEFRAKFEESIQLHMRSDVENGISLSGGLDSSTIGSLVGKNFPELNIKTFNAYYAGDFAIDERPFADSVNAKYPNLLPHYIQPSDTELRDHIERAVYQNDIPLGGPSPFSQYFVLKLAAENGIKVILDGQGSDEYLIGYMHSFYRIIGTYLRQFKFAKAYQVLADHRREHHLSNRATAYTALLGGMSFFKKEDDFLNMEFKRKYPFLGIQPMQECIELENKHASRIDDHLYQMFAQTTLPTFLHYSDRNAMAFSIEARVPFLDHRLVEYAFTLPIGEKVHRGQTKYLLRESMKDVLPPKIYERKDKIGFGAPGEVKWLKGPLKDLLDMDLSLMEEVLNIPKTKKLLNQYLMGDYKNATLIWRIAMLHLWMKMNKMSTFLS